MQKELTFPKGFFWGSATSAYQVEGGIENNDWAEAARQNFPSENLGGQACVPPAGRACDSYNRYEEDFDIAKSLGQNAHRFSIEWARIEPEEGRFSEAEIEHYRKVLMALRERGIEPFVTLWHFTLPVWFARVGGFENSKAPFYFSRYCEYVVKNLGQGIGAPRFWITTNEPIVFASMGFLSGQWPPFKKWHQLPHLFHYLKTVKNMVMSHNIAYGKIKKINADFKIGVAHQCTYFKSSRNPVYKIVSAFLNWFNNLRFLNKISGHQDFIGLNHYFCQKVSLGAGRGDRLATTEENRSKVSDMGWEIYPPSIYKVLMQLKKYNRPIYITENGIADAKDEKRANFIKDYLYQVWRAIQDGVNVRGYFYWSLLDNYEWADGFKPRFGLVEVDYKTLERKIRPSAYEYKKICETNSLTLN